MRLTRLCKRAVATSTILTAIAVLTHAQGEQHDSLIPVTLRPVEKPTTPDLRDFESSHTISLHSSKISKDANPLELTTWTWTHDEYSYVDLEKIEPWLRSGRVRCDNKALARNLTTLVLPFENADAFTMTKDKWQNGDKLLFVVEGERCFEGPGDRSVYRSHEIRWDDEQARVTIEAMPLRAQMTIKSGWVQRLRSDPNTFVPPGSFPEPRPSTGVVWVPSPVYPQAIEKRLLHKSFNKTFNWDYGPHYDFWMKSVNTSAPHVGIPRVGVVCLDCHGKGAFTAGVAIEFDFSKGTHRDQEPGCIIPRSDDPASRKSSQIAQRHEAFMELTRRQEHIDLASARRLTKRDSEDDDDEDYFASDACSPMTDPSYPICSTDDIIAWHDKCDNDNPLLHPGSIVDKTVLCIRDVLNGDNDCWSDFTEAAAEFDGPKDYFNQFLIANLAEAKGYVNVTEDVNLRFQTQLELDVVLGFWLDLDFYPYVIKPSFGMFAGQGGGSAQIVTGGSWKFPKDKTPAEEPKKPEPPGHFDNTDLTNKGNGKGQNGVSWGEAVSFTPLRIELTASLHVKGNITFPGFALELSKGFMSVDFLAPEKERVMNNTITTNMTYLYGDVHIGDEPSASVTVAAGPNLSIDIVSSKGSMFEKFSKRMGEPFTIAAFLTVVRVDHTFTLVKASDAFCTAQKEKREKDELPWRGGIKIEQVIRHGLLVFASIFYQRIIDTNWLGKLQHKPYATTGLFYSWNPNNWCLEFSEEDAEILEHFSEALHNWLHRIQEPLAEWIEETENWLNLNRDKIKLRELGMSDMSPLEQAHRYAVRGQAHPYNDFTETSPHWRDLFQLSPGEEEAYNAMMRGLSQFGSYNFSQSPFGWTHPVIAPKPPIPLIEPDITGPKMPEYTHINSTQENEPGLQSLIAAVSSAMEDPGGNGPEPTGTAVYPVPPGAFPRRIRF